MSALISIIIPTYNRAHFIGETLESVIAQTYQKWECIVVDDGSSDYTNELMEFYCEKDSRIQYHNRPSNKPKGANACRNYGLEISNGDFINWFDSDDLMHKDKLAIQYKILSNSALNFCVCNSLTFEGNKDNIIENRNYKIYSANFFSDYLQKKIIWLTQSPLWKKDFLKSLDYCFNESLQASQEWEFHCRILLQEKEYCYTDMKLVFIRKHNQSITHSLDKDFSTLRDESYAKSRMLLYNLIKNKKDFITDKEYLSKMLLVYFKKFVLTNNYKFAKIILKRIVKNSEVIKAEEKMFCFLSYYSFRLTNKGYIFLNKIRPN